MNKSIAHYGLMFVGFSLMTYGILIAFTWALYTFVPSVASSILEGGGGTGLSVVTVILPTMLIAQRFYKHEARTMGGAEGWGFAILFTVLAILISVALVFAYVKLAPGGDLVVADLKSIYQSNPGLVSKIFGGFSLFYLVMVRVMLWTGVRGAIKQEAKLAAKAAAAKG